MLRQARSDFEVAEILKGRGDDIARCHLLHYLQMALEKLAKSLVLPPNSGAPPRSHAGAAKAFQALGKGQIAVANQIQKRLTMGNSAWKGYMVGLTATVAFIEKLAPALANAPGSSGINPEYPWPLAGDPPAIIAPADYGFPDPEEGKLVKLMEFLRRLFSVLLP